MFILDTNALIHALKGIGGVRGRMLALPPGDIAIPAVVAFEVEYGTLGLVNPERRRRNLSHLLGTLDILPFDSRAAARSARLRYELERAGEKIGPLDTLIAGTALACGGTLVTHNTREFSRVPGLLIEDWY
ncbi:MAG TPA: PIN domain-containing protein [Bryobacteraceae bacterium]|nr:PIN domain-containing protein [Bryobacteraceae bacterium]